MNERNPPQHRYDWLSLVPTRFLSARSAFIGGESIDFFGRRFLQQHGSFTKTRVVFQFDRCDDSQPEKRHISKQTRSAATIIEYNRNVSYAFIIRV
jgi:hypothetical protein